MKDNTLLVEFEFIIDLDMGLFKYIRENFYSSDYVNKPIIAIGDEYQIIDLMLNRYTENPLPILFNPNIETETIYNELLNTPERYVEILKRSRAYDTFGLMVTMMKNLSSVDIDILCKNKIEEEYIHKLNSKLHTVVYEDKFDIDLQPYTVMYVKYFSNLLDYDIEQIKGKHIFIASALYNMDPDDDSYVNINLTMMFSDINIIHLIDLYRGVKFRIAHDEENSTEEDLEDEYPIEYSATE